VCGQIPALNTLPLREELLASTPTSFSYKHLKEYTYELEIKVNKENFK
jgi:hypothetical protein